MKKSKKGLLCKDYRNKMFKCKGVTAWYSNTLQAALKNISFTILKPSLVLIAGPNGSGKTTLLRVMRGLHKEFGMNVKGAVEVNKMNIIEELPENLYMLGIVFQRPATQLFTSRVKEEIELAPQLLGFSWKDILKREKEVIQEINISNILEKNVHEISAGEQQKTVLAASLMPRPNILLLDEPASFLDPVSRKKFFKKLKELVTLGITIFMSSHRLEEEIRYADYLLVLNNGFLEMQGSPNKIMFTKKAEKIIPSRGFLKISKQLWQKGFSRKFFLDSFEISSFLKYRKSAKTKTAKTNKERKIENLNAELAIQFKNVDAKYSNGTIALQNLNTRIPKNAITTILGLNGSGKTTLAKLCLKLLKPSKGQILIDGIDTRKIKKQELSQKIGFSPQDPREILFHETVFKEMFESAKTLKISKPYVKAKKILKLFGLLKSKNKAPEILSLGQQRKLTIALALLADPRIIILDEPESALDSKSLDQLLKILIKLKHKVSIVILTHDINHFVPLSDYVIILKEGQVLKEGNPLSVMTKQIIQRANLEFPELYEQWKTFPKAKTWDELTKLEVKLLCKQ